jgi:hypothetical protein
MTTLTFTADYLIYFIVPLWIVFGFLDWDCHRRGRIEASSGTGESLIHMAMLVQGGCALFLGLYAEIDALVLAVMIALWLAHEITSYWDLVYANHRRVITAFEQRVHDYLAVLPLVALSLVLVLHWQQALALVRSGPAEADFSLRWKDTSLPLGYLLALPVVVAVLGLCYIEELARCLRHRAVVVVTKG